MYRHRLGRNLWGTEPAFLESHREVAPTVYDVAPKICRSVDRHQGTTGKMMILKMEIELQRIGKDPFKEVYIQNHSCAAGQANRGLGIEKQGIIRIQKRIKARKCFLVLIIE